jgi:ABC-2 type transport system ATP-binding protein
VRSQSGTTLFLTTHYLEEAEEADAICIINHGKIVSYGTPAQVKADLVENYLLVDAEDREALRHELRAMGLAFTPQAPYKITLDGHGPHALLKAIDTPLTTVQVHMPTLEDAYLAIVEEEEIRNQKSESREEEPVVSSQ